VITLLGWLLGIANGIRHALEPDHVAAISTLVAEERSARRSATFAAMWGIGHGAMLLVVGGTLVLLRTRMPERIEQLFELAVSLMLVLLGGRAIRAAVILARGAKIASSPMRRPLLIGVMHGLAGSGALTALIASQMPSALAGIITLVLYGIGATVGMMLLASVASVPLERFAKSERAMPTILGITGAASLVLGMLFGVQALMLL
jgi:cytochrome c biogenesis protein CcdA